MSHQEAVDLVLYLMVYIVGGGFLLCWGLYCLISFIRGGGKLL